MRIVRFNGKTRSVGLVLMLANAAVFAESGDSSSMRGCRSIVEDVARLHCYDSLTAPPSLAAPVATPAATVAPAAAEAIEPTVPVPVASSSSDFGVETVKSKPQETKSQKLAAHVVGQVEYSRKGERYRLDNGQVWQNVDDREVQLDIDNSAVSIERNFIGSYWMTPEGKSRSVKVRRIQ